MIKVSRLLIKSASVLWLFQSVDEAARKLSNILRSATKIVYSDDSEGTFRGLYSENEKVKAYLKPVNGNTWQLDMVSQPPKNVIMRNYSPGANQVTAARTLKPIQEEPDPSEGLNFLQKLQPVDRPPIVWSKDDYAIKTNVNGIDSSTIKTGSTLAETIIAWRQENCKPGKTCLEYANSLKKKFPELKLFKGSHSSQDPNDTAHFWVEDDEGLIFDPWADEREEGEYTKEREIPEVTEEMRTASIKVSKSYKLWLSPSGEEREVPEGDEHASMARELVPDFDPDYEYDAFTEALKRGWIRIGAYGGTTYVEVWRLSRQNIGLVQTFIMTHPDFHRYSTVMAPAEGPCYSGDTKDFLTMNSPADFRKVAKMVKVSRLLKAAETPDITSKFPPQLITLLNKLNSFGEFYLVGGCIRDALLGRTPKDFDIMVVKPTPEELEKILPVQKVGASFPVYLYDTEDPELGTIEFAYARKETKTGVGYKGFDFEIVNDVKEDLARRDLTINALAWNPSSGLVSFDERSLQDVKSQTLRHVTDAFAEDPLRVFRAARFSAQLPGDWNVDGETINLMRSLKDELPSLAIDRVRVELEKSLKAPLPGNFFKVLHAADCMDYWFPELEPNLAQCVQLINGAAKSFEVIEMYAFLAQAMQNAGDIKSFCKRLSLAWEREMTLWFYISHCSFSKPEDFLTIFRGGKGGKLNFDSIYPMMKQIGLSAHEAKLQEIVSKLKSLDYSSMQPKDIPAMMYSTVKDSM